MFLSLPSPSPSHPLPNFPTGVSAQGGAFDQYVCEKMASLNEKPLIFALSNPTSKAECTASQAYEWTKGNCVFASGSPFDPVTISDGRHFTPGQGNNAYIFPGVGLGAIAANAMTITDDDLYVAAATLASLVTKDRLDMGCAYPPLSEIRTVSAKIATAVALNIYKDGRNNGGSTVKPPADMEAHCKSLMYVPSY
jgi:malate dehydrogenase (oxaloacetate-decarboxylating)(NADP+)